MSWGRYGGILERLGAILEDVLRCPGGHLGAVGDFGGPLGPSSGGFGSVLGRMEAARAATRRFWKPVLTNLAFQGPASGPNLKSFRGSKW